MRARHDLATTRAWAADGTRLVVAALADLRDDGFPAPSLLPGWTRAHVVAHLARNAEALTRLATWARTGVETPMYVSPEQRDAEIETSARQPPSTCATTPPPPRPSSTRPSPGCPRPRGTPRSGYGRPSWSRPGCCRGCVCSRCGCTRSTSTPGPTSPLPPPRCAEVAEQGRTVHAVTADVTDDMQVQRLVDTTVGLLGGLDVLVSNAGTCHHGASFDVTDEEWSWVFDLDVRALFVLSRAAARHMKDHGGGAIVKIDSMSGAIVNRPQWQPAYNARQGRRAPPHLIAGGGVGGARHPRQRCGARLRQDRDVTGRPARAAAVLDRGRLPAAVRDARGDRPRPWSSSPATQPRS